jgi:RNA polymerase sigma-70 factor (ECF subfamily)
MSEARPASDAAPADVVDAGTTVELLARARHGDRVALEALFTRHGPRLRRWASGRLPSWARDMTDTDDLVQDAMMQTFKRLEGFDARGTGALYAYLRQAVLNRVKDELRRKGRRPSIVTLDGMNVDEGPSPLELAIGREALDRYETALGRLTPDDQEAIIGRIELGCSYEELAESLDKPSADAARKAAQRALVRLIAEMDQLVSDRGPHVV